VRKLTEEEKQKLKEKIQKASTNKTDRILDNSATASLQKLTAKNILRFIYQSFIWRFLAIYQGFGFGYSALMLLALKRPSLMGNFWLHILVILPFFLAGAILGRNTDRIWKRVCLACGAVIATVLVLLLCHLLSTQEVPFTPVKENYNILE
jgi:hypothetical protein